MTDVELEKKAKEYADKHYDDTDEYGAWFSDVEMLRRAYIAGAKELQKENEQLKAQIEKMKCCGNCKHKNERYQVNGICDSCFVDDDKWELKESKRI